MATIYYADDEKEIRDIVSAFLINSGYEVKAFATGDLLFAAFKEKPCDLVLFDIMMPGTDGIGILRELRKISNVPVILLTAKDTDSDYYNGLLLGSDDYITKPFKPMILSAKIHALLRRIQYESRPAGQKEMKDLDCGNLHYSNKRQEFFVDGKPIALTPTERKFLEFMMGRFEETVGKSEVLYAVWDMGHDVESRVADETNRRLRKKLTAAGASVYVQTVWGYGFKLTKKELAV